jgi:outer membrane protein TolC
MGFSGIALLPGWSAEPRGKHDGSKETVGGNVTQTASYQQYRRFEGNLTLEKAVEIALHQNPDVLRAIQEIQRTRGLIIEVRAAALPQLTLTGDYDQQDKRLLRGGGFTGGSQGTITNTQATSNLESSSPSTSQTAAGFVGNTNTTGTGLATGGTDATGGATGLTAARARRPFNSNAVPTTGAGGAITNSTTSTTTSTGNASSEDVLNQIQDALGQNLNSNDVQDKSWDVTLEVRQVIYAGGQIAAAIRIAKLTQDSSYYALRDTVDTVVAQVREQFYTVLLNRALITVAEEAVRLAEEQLQDQRNRFDAGTVPRFNVLRAEVEVANQQPVLIRARNDYLLAQVQLAKSLGLSPGVSGKPEFNCVGELTVSQRTMSLPDALKLAQARRPFLKVQRQAILIDCQQVTVEMAGYKPRVDAHGGYELRNRSSSTDLSDVANGWFFGVTGSWNIFDGFETYGRVKQARARLEQSKINYDDSVREVDLEVQTAYANLDQARQTIESQRKNVEEALEALRLAQERFSAGAGTQLEILDARVALTQARTTELQARSDFNRDLAEFDRATATTTVYHESFKDPMEKVEKGIYARLAETGLPKIPPTDADEPGKKKP